MNTLFILISILLSYLIGSIPMSYILARNLGGIDIRAHGSGNVGATNVYRVLGKLPGALALLLDIGKGLFVVTILAYYFNFYISMDEEMLRIVLGLSAIAGHIWTVFLGFKGGKGIATSIGVLIVIAPKALILSAIVWLVVFIAKRYVSLASLASALSLPIFSFLFYSSRVSLLCITLWLITSYKHKSNIIRLLKGEEYRFVKQKSINK